MSEEKFSPKLIAAAQDVIKSIIKKNKDVRDKGEHYDGSLNDAEEENVDVYEAMCFLILQEILSSVESILELSKKENMKEELASKIEKVKEKIGNLDIDTKSKLNDPKYGTGFISYIRNRINILNLNLGPIGEYYGTEVDLSEELAVLKEEVSRKVIF
jgi:hypothetical protein